MIKFQLTLKWGPNISFLVSAQLNSLRLIMKVKGYYLKGGLRDNQPFAIYRFFEDTSKSPEVFSVTSCKWKEGNLWPYLASGEIDDADKVTEQEALELANQWAANDKKSGE